MLRRAGMNPNMIDSLIQPATNLKGGA